MVQPFIPVRSLPSDPSPRQISDVVNQILKNFPQFGGQDYRSIKTITAAQQTQATDWTVLVDCSAGAVTISLAPVATSSWRVLNYKKIDSSANAMVLDGNAAETIDGATTKSTTTRYANFQIHCDGAAWYVL